MIVRRTFALKPPLHDGRDRGRLRPDVRHQARRLPAGEAREDGVLGQEQGGGPELFENQLGVLLPEPFCACVVVGGRVMCVIVMYDVSTQEWMVDRLLCGSTRRSADPLFAILTYDIIILLGTYLGVLKARSTRRTGVCAKSTERCVRFACAQISSTRSQSSTVRGCLCVEPRSEPSDRSMDPSHTEAGRSRTEPLRQRAHHLQLPIIGPQVQLILAAAALALALGRRPRVLIHPRPRIAPGPDAGVLRFVRSFVRLFVCAVLTPSVCQSVRQSGRGEAHAKWKVGTYISPTAGRTEEK